MKQLNKQIDIRSIEHDEITKTLDYISKCTNISMHDLHVIGSCAVPGKGGNDIDIAIDINKFHPDLIHHYIQLCPCDIKSSINRGLGIWSYAFPIEGDEKNGFVQVDFMYVESIEWAKFSYLSNPCSMYKSAARNILLSAVATVIDIPGKTLLVYDNDLLIARASFGIDPSIGLKMVYQMRYRSQRGDRWLSRLENVSPKTLQEHFPKETFDMESTVINDPDTVVKMLFGEVKAVNNAEQVMIAIRTSFNREERINIFKRAENRLNRVKDKMKIPDLTEYTKDKDAA